MSYILGIDQSTQGTKAILVDENGKIVGRADRAHKQIINEQGWVSHDLNEIYENVLLATKDVLVANNIDAEEVLGIGISNQRETTAMWDKSGTPLKHAIVWQCSRAKEITQGLDEYADLIKDHTGLQLSPYFPAAKMAWLLQNTEIPEDKKDDICLGTIDTWLIYRMTNGNSFKTDYSNASRTQLFSIKDLKWDEEICKIFRIPKSYLAQVCDSNSLFGMTSLDGIFPKKIPIYSAMGDSHAALFGQGCHSSGKIKTTYGTGSSIMMNVGVDYIKSQHGLVTSLAWGIDGKVDYVLEGNINYTGAVITWLKDDVKLIDLPAETSEAAKNANPADETVLVPAFSGLSAPYWNDKVKALLYGMSRTTGKNEIIKSALESIVFQINAVLDAMKKDSGIDIKELRVDGGPTKNSYLMQLQSDISNLVVTISDVEELSALGTAYLAGITMGFYQKDQLFAQKEQHRYVSGMEEDLRQKKIGHWQEAIDLLIK
ncbi:Glycerol kinase [Lachnospiraceae bacterium TWA4]|nr:Glycerol kinase [Lachnospiraceae bacterium TWA4]